MHISSLNTCHVAAKLTLLATTLLAVPASASLALVDDATFGSKAAAIDSQTGKIWLKPVHSTGISYDQMIQHIATNGSYNGYQIATAAEFVTMAKNYSLPFGNFIKYDYFGNYTYDAQIVAGGRGFIELFEPTFVTEFYINGEPKWPVYRLTAFLLQESMGPYVDASDIRYDAPGAPPYIFESIQAASLTFPYITLSASSNGIGFWMVRQSEAGIVPEPATWAMLIAGFGLVGAAARRQRRTTTAV